MLLSGALMNRNRTLACVLPFFLVIAACNRTSPEQSANHPLDLGVTFAPLELPAKSGKAQPPLPPPSKGGILGWVDQDEASTTLRFSERTASGWSQPQDV